MSVFCDFRTRATGKTPSAVSTENGHVAGCSPAFSLRLLPARSAAQLWLLFRPEFPSRGNCSALQAVGTLRARLPGHFLSRIALPLCQTPGPGLETVGISLLPFPPLTSTTGSHKVPTQGS